MALCSTKMVEVLEKQKQYVLELTPEELCVLYDVLRSVGGSVETSPRKYVANILDNIRKYFYYINFDLKKSDEGYEIWYEEQDVKVPHCLKYF